MAHVESCDGRKEQRAPCREMVQDKTARKALGGDSFPLTQTRVKTTQVVCSQAHDREGSKQSGLDRPCIPTKTTRTAGSSKQQFINTKTWEMAKKSEKGRATKRIRERTICRQVVSRASVGGGAQSNALQEVAGPPLSDRRAATHGMHRAARMRLTSRQQFSH